MKRLRFNPLSFFQNFATNLGRVEVVNANVHRKKRLEEKGLLPKVHPSEPFEVVQGFKKNTCWKHHLKCHRW